MIADLSQALIENIAPANEWFQCGWQDIHEWKAWAEKHATHEWPREELSHILQNYLSDIHASKTQIKTAKKIKNKNVYLIVCGQQPAYGGGPLYSLVKLAHSISIARELRENGFEAYPLFWCASEDHDLGEANHLDLLQIDKNIKRINVELDAAKSLRFQNAHHGWDILFNALKNIRADKPQALGHEFIFNHAPQDGEGYGQWMNRFLAALLPDEPLLFLEPHLLRELWEKINIDAIWPTAALAKHRQTVAAEGIPLSFDSLDEAPLFIDDEAGRRAYDRKTTPHSQSLSTGAALRPIIQQYCLPCSAFCAGPGEIQYHALLNPLYDAFLYPNRFLYREHALVLPHSALNDS